jgi:hypothetical protein
VSGGAFNPAVGFGLPLCAGEIEVIPLSLMGPLTGAARASFFYYLINFKVTICKADFSGFPKKSGDVSLAILPDSCYASCPHPIPFTGVQDRMS